MPRLSRCLCFTAALTVATACGPVAPSRAADSDPHMADPVDELANCPMRSKACIPYQEGGYTGPIKPREPSCIILPGRDMGIQAARCICDARQYAQEVADYAICQAGWNGGRATAAYNAAVDVFNCRLLPDACPPVSSLHHDLDGSDSPDMPSCLAYPPGKLFRDEDEALRCRAELDHFEEEITDWVAEQDRSAVNEAEEKISKTQRRIDCYAAGNEFCF